MSAVLLCMRCDGTRTQPHASQPHAPTRWLQPNPKSGGLLVPLAVCLAAHSYAMQRPCCVYMSNTGIAVCLSKERLYTACLLLLHTRHACQCLLAITLHSQTLFNSNNAARAECLLTTQQHYNTHLFTQVTVAILPNTNLHLSVLCTTTRHCKHLQTPASDNNHNLHP